MAATATPTNLTEILELFTNIGLTIVPLLGVVAFLVFIWGVARFIKSGGNEKEVKDSKGIIIWRIVGLFVLFTIWGIISFLKSELGFDSDTVVPQIQF